MTDKAAAAISWADPKLLALAGTIVFSAGGAWVKIAYLSEDVAEVAEDLEAEEEAREAADAGIQTEIAIVHSTTQRTAENVARLCQALEVACK